MLENCINTAMCRMFRSCGRSSLEYNRMCAKLDNMTDLIQRECDKFVDQLLGDRRFINLFLFQVVFCYTFNFDVCSVCFSVFVLLTFCLIYCIYLRNKLYINSPPF